MIAKCQPASSTCAAFVPDGQQKQCHFRQPSSGDVEIRETSDG